MQGLKYISWADNTGYATAAKAYLRALLKTELALSWTPMLPGSNLYEPYTGRDCPEPDLAPLYNRLIDHDTVLIHTVPEYYPALIAQERRPGVRVFGYTTWELDQLPDHWPAILNQLDGVIVPCRWNLELFRKSGVTVPIHVVAHLSQFPDGMTTCSVDERKWQARIAAQAHGQPFVFYTIGQWSERKAPFLALQAYWQAFNADDPVVMVIKTSATDFTRFKRQWRSRLRRRHPPLTGLAHLAGYTERPPVVLVADETLSDSEMLALHEVGDCFVSLARTEGWGLGAFEAARLGNPVVTTHYGGQLEYLRPDLCWLVACKMVPVQSEAASSYRRDCHWAEPCVSHAAEHLKTIFNDRAAARSLAMRQAEEIAVAFSSDATVTALLMAMA